ncbi:DUF5368 domain-containing protein [Yoonia sp. GPGPB17]|uniref:DUF5368 domain-containing protein n=1 Tax=Yoonia sp. GPGPB17 TaxID=3026147 RepID=UPI0030C1E917
MQEISFETLLYVLIEVFGPVLFWLMVGVAAVVTLAYLFVLIRDRAVSWRKFLWAQLSMPVGAVAAVGFVMWVTDSNLRDMGGPIDLIILLGVAIIGAIGIAILVYTAEALLLRKDPQ